jgi:diguanylate cyclase (GGDEF)-like protein
MRVRFDYSRLAARGSVTASIVVITIALAVLAGWAFDIEPLMTLLPGYVRMKPNTALAFLAAGTVLLLDWRGTGKTMRKILASVILGIGTLTLFEYLTGISLGIDQLLVRDTVQHTFPGRMAHVTAGNLAFLGIALLCRDGGPRLSRLGHTLSLAVGLSALLAVVGYVYGVPLLYGSSSYTAMALHTGSSFLLLALATVFIDPNQGLARRFWSHSSGGAVSRRLLPASVIVPVVLGGIFIKTSVSVHELRLSLALSVMSSVILMGLLITWLARSLGLEERARMLAERHSWIDGLTGAFNRRAFDDRLARESARSNRLGTPLSLILLDIDHFKKVNDTHGHLVGDDVIRLVATAAGSQLRSTDTLCRYGGEEFAILLPDTSLHAAAIVAGKVRRSIAEAELAELGLRVTASAGVTDWRNGEDGASDLVRRADLALYDAKRSGRDQVRTFVSGPREVLTVPATVQPEMMVIGAARLSVVA